MSGGWVLVGCVVALGAALLASRTQWAARMQRQHPRWTRVASGGVFGLVFFLGGRYFAHHSWTGALVTGVVAGVGYGLLMYLAVDRNTEAA